MESGSIGNYFHDIQGRFPELKHVKILPKKNSNSEEEKSRNFDVAIPHAKKPIDLPENENSTNSKIPKKST